MKKIILFILATALFITFSQPALAVATNSSTITPRYSYIETYIANLTINEDTGVATCKASCYSAVGCTVEVNCSLQRYENASWKTIKSWTSTGYEYANIRQYWAVPSGYIYRIFVIYIIRDSAGNIIETESVTRAYNYPG